MRLISSRFDVEYMAPKDVAYNIIATAMRNCYRAELNAMPLDDTRMVEKAIKMRHYSVLEHSMISLNITCDRGVSHELVRHRIAAYSQESTRYCNYFTDKFDKEVTFVIPSWVTVNSEMATDTSKKYSLWLETMSYLEKAYIGMLEEGASAQEARAVLPNSLATKIAISTNFREWLHILNLRCSKHAHPDMRLLMLKILELFNSEYPEIFGSLFTHHQEDIKLCQG